MRKFNSWAKSVQPSKLICQESNKAENLDLYQVFSQLLDKVTLNQSAKFPFLKFPF